MLDGDETNASDDSDGDETSNILDPDRENDGLFDGTELGLDCSHPATDPEAGLCTPDADAGSTITWMLDAVTDDGGVSDGDEDSNRNGAIDDGERDPNDPADDLSGGGEGGAAETAGAAGSAGAATAGLLESTAGAAGSAGSATGAVSEG